MSSHRRLNPLTGEWVLVSPHRLARPWRGRVEPVERLSLPAYDPECYLCPGNTRAGDVRNPDYQSTFVFDNDFPALVAEPGGDPRDDGGLIVSRPEAGICRVVCFSPRHDASLPDLTPAEALAVVRVWIEQAAALAAVPWVAHVQVFENRGAAMGASNPHPHCQIWANAQVPDIPRQEQSSQAAYRQASGSCLLCDYLALERADGERVVWENERFTALVPFWAVWPYELLLLPRRHVSGFDGLDSSEQAGLAEAVQQVVRIYDRRFAAACPYSMGFHQRPVRGAADEAWHLHAHYYPPVLRSAAVHKFMVGYELLATPQRDLTPEAAAAALREVL